LVDLCDVLYWLVVVVGVWVSSVYGEYVVGEIVCGVVDEGFVVVSGLVYGVDGVVYCVVMMSGCLVVVFVGGIDWVYL